MGNGYFRTTETYKENKRNKDLLYNYVDRVRLSTNTIRDYKGPPPRGYGWRHKKSVLHLDLATSCHNVQETTTGGLSNYWSESISKNLQHSRSLDNDKFTQDCSDELDVVELYWPELDPNMEEDIDAEQQENMEHNHNSSNLDISCERTWPYKYHSNILRKTNLMLDNKKSVPATILHAFDFEDEPYNLRRARSLSVIHEETFNEHKNSMSANGTQRRLQLIPRAHLFNQNHNNREHNRVLCENNNTTHCNGMRKSTQPTWNAKQKHLEHCELNRNSQCRCKHQQHYQKIQTHTQHRYQQHYQKHAWRQGHACTFSKHAPEFMHQWYNNDKSDLESLNSDYFKNSLHQQQELQTCELKRTNFDFNTLEQTMSLYAEDKLPRIYQSKRRQNQIQIQRRRKQYKQQQQFAQRDAATSDAEEDSVSDDDSQTTLVLETTTSHVEDYSTTSDSEQEYDIAGMDDLEDDASNYELISLTTTTHTHTHMNRTETDLVSDTETTTYDNLEDTENTSAELDKTELNGDCSSCKSFGKLIAYDSVYLSSEEGSDDIMAAKTQINEIKQNDVVVAEQTKPVELEENEKGKCQEDDNASLNCSDMELGVNNAQFITNAFNKLNRQIKQADDNVTMQATVKESSSNLSKNQYHSLPDVSIGRSLKVSESIDAKLRSSYNLIRYNCKANIGRRAELLRDRCKIKLRNDVNNKKQINYGKQFRKRVNHVNASKCLTATNQEEQSSTTQNETEIKTEVQIEHNESIAASDIVEQKLPIVADAISLEAVTIEQEVAAEDAKKLKQLENAEIDLNLCATSTKTLDRRIKNLPISRVSSLRVHTNSFKRLQKCKTTNSTPNTLTKNYSEAKRRPSVPPIDEEYLRKVDAVRAYWSNYAEQQMTENNQKQEQKLLLKNSTDCSKTTTTNTTVAATTTTTTALVTSNAARVLSDTESSTATQQFDHIRYKVLKSEQLICSGRKATQLDELLRKYLQEYSFQEFFAHNNVVIVEPVRSNMSGPLCKRLDNCANKQTTMNNNNNNKMNNINMENRRKNDGIKRNFFFQPIRVNRELYENELPNPNTVRKVRKFFEQHQLLITRKQNSDDDSEQQQEQQQLEHSSGTEQQELEQTECLLAPDTLDILAREQQQQPQQQMHEEQVNWNLCNLTYGNFDQNLASALCEFAKRSYQTEKYEEAAAAAAAAAEADKSKCIRVQDVIKRHNSNNNSFRKLQHIAAKTTCTTNINGNSNATLDTNALDTMLKKATPAHYNNNNNKKNLALDVCPDSNAEPLGQLSSLFSGTNTDDILNNWPDMSKQLYMAYEQHADDAYDAQNKLSVQMTTEVKFVGHNTEQPAQEQQRQTAEQDEQNINLQQEQVEKCDEAETFAVNTSSIIQQQQQKIAGNLNKSKTTLVDETVKRHYVANDKILFQHRKYDDIKFEQFEVYKHFPEDENVAAHNHNNNNNNNITSVNKQRADDMGCDTAKCQGQINNTSQNRNDCNENCTNTQHLNADKAQNYDEYEDDEEVGEHTQSETDCYDSLDDKL